MHQNPEFAFKSSAADSTAAGQLIAHRIYRKIIFQYRDIIRKVPITTFHVKNTHPHKC
jgi:hypothetical protein